MQRVTLKNGLRVATFNCSHDLKFETGEVLQKCSRKRIAGLPIRRILKVNRASGGWRDVSISFELTEVVVRELQRIQKDGTIDLCIIPYNIIGAMERTGMIVKNTKFRACLKVPNIKKKIIRSDRFEL